MWIPTELGRARGADAEKPPYGKGGQGQARPTRKATAGRASYPSAANEVPLVPLPVGIWDEGDRIGEVGRKGWPLSRSKRAR